MHSPFFLSCHLALILFPFAWWVTSVSPSFSISGGTYIPNRPRSPFFRPYQPPFDEIFKRQPFFLSVLLGYHLDLTAAAMDELMKVYFIIWEFFKDNKDVRLYQITENQFERIQLKNLHMLKYAEGESSVQERNSIYQQDLQNVRSKALLTSVLFLFNSRPALLSMDEKIKGIIYIGIRTFIKCFETIS